MPSGYDVICFRYQLTDYQIHINCMPSFFRSLVAADDYEDFISKVPLPPR